MAESIDEMRHCIPHLKNSTKAYSQAKVVAFALQHIYDLQAENARLRTQFGLGEREDSAIPDLKALRLSKKKRNSSPKKVRPSKRQRLEDDMDDDGDDSPEDKVRTVQAQVVSSVVYKPKGHIEDEDEEDEEEINVLSTTPAAPAGQAQVTLFPDGAVFPLDSMDSDEYISESDTFSPTLVPSNPFDSVGGREYGTPGDSAMAPHLKNSWDASSTPNQGNMLYGYSPIDSFGYISGSPLIGKF